MVKKNASPTTTKEYPDHRLEDIFNLDFEDDFTYEISNQLIVPSTINNIPSAPIAATEEIPISTPLATINTDANLPCYNPSDTIVTPKAYPATHNTVAQPYNDHSSYAFTATETCPTTHNTTANLPYHHPSNIDVTNIAAQPYNNQSSYIFTAVESCPTTHNNGTILYYNPSYTVTPTETIPTVHNSDTLVCYDPSFAVTTTENYPMTQSDTIMPYNDPFYIGAAVETYPTAHNTASEICMTTHNATALLNSQPQLTPNILSSLSGLPMAPIYPTNQFNRMISSPAYTSYSSDLALSQRFLNLLNYGGMEQSTLDPCSFINNNGLFGGVPYTDGTRVSTYGAGSQFGFFPDAGMAVRQSEAMEAGNFGMFSSRPMHRVYDPGDLKALGDRKHLMAGCSTSTAPLQVASDIPITLEESSNFKIAKLTVEEKKRKIDRYKQKKNSRDYRKRVKYICRKTLADSRHRVRGRFAKNNEVPKPAPGSSGDD